MLWPQSLYFQPRGRKSMYRNLVYLIFLTLTHLINKDICAMTAFSLSWHVVFVGGWLWSADELHLAHGQGCDWSGEGCWTSGTSECMTWGGPRAQGREECEKEHGANRGLRLRRQCPFLSHVLEEKAVHCLL